MPFSRIVTLVIGLIIILGLALWLIDSLSRLYWQLSYSPLLGNLLLFLLVILLVGLVAAFVYYVLILPTGETKSPRPRVTAAQIPAAKSDAASTTLQAVRQQVAQIQDEVTRQAVLS